MPLVANQREVMKSLLEMLNVFEHKTQYLLIHAPYTRIVLFYISVISPRIFRRFKIKKCSADISLPSFMKKSITIDISNGANVIFLHRVPEVHRISQILLKFLDLRCDHQLMLNLFWGVYILKKNPMMYLPSHAILAKLSLKFVHGCAV